MALTKHPEGSIRELWTISFPLMLSSLSVMLMIFVDRLLLARYSMDAMNAAVNASTMGWAFVAGWIGLGSISEVFVAQYNGAGQRKRIGEPVWQMIWVGAASIFFFWAVADWGRFLIYGTSATFELEREYFRWMIYFGPAFAVYAALTGFFVGRGKTRIITVLAFVANFVNGVLDYILIFGIEGWVPSMGVKGAAIATSFSGVFEMFVLIVLFLRPQYQRDFGTNAFRIKWKPLIRCLKVGLPGAIFIAVEIFGWGVYYMIMTRAGTGYITIAGIAQSVIILFYFFAEGMGKAATALAGNFIGSKKEWNIAKLIRAGLALNLLFFIFMGACLGVFSDVVVDLFLPEATAEFVASIHEPLMVSLFCMIFYLFFEGVRFLFSGILTAAGDTLFLFLAGSSFMWLFLVLPIYVAVIYLGVSIVTASFICVLYSAGSCGIYYWRYLHGGWKSHNLIEA